MSRLSSVSFVSIAASLLLAGGASTSWSQAIDDPALKALVESHADADALRAADARLAARGDDPVGWAALVRLARTTAEADLHKVLKARIEDCQKNRPTVAACQYGVGELALRESGTLGLAMRGTRIRESLARALALDPEMLDARVTLVHFYLDTGRLSGGSADKAREVAQGTPESQRDMGAFLQALVEEHEDRLDEAARLLATVKAGTDAQLEHQVHDQWARLADAWMSRKQPGPAREVYERFAKEHPTDPAPRLDLVRSLVALKSYDEAIAQLESMQKLPQKDKAALSLDYRLGQVWQAKGDGPRARAAYYRYLSSAAAKADPDQAADARSRLADLN